MSTPFWSNDGAALGPAGTGQPVSVWTSWSGEGPLSSRDSHGGSAQEACSARGHGGFRISWGREASAAKEAEAMRTVIEMHQESKGHDEVRSL